MKGKLVFVTGGIRSGKSAFAEEVTAQLGTAIAYIATAEALDDEMEHRIKLHRERRPDNWTTVEEPLQVTDKVRALGIEFDVIMLDCLTILLSNMMFAEEQKAGGEFKKEFQDAIIEEISSLAKAARESRAHVVIVSNEVGMTLVSDNFLGRQYQELVGRANQIIAGLADEAYLVVAGHPIDLKRRRS